MRAGFRKAARLLQRRASCWWHRRSRELERLAGWTQDDSWSGRLIMHWQVVHWTKTRRAAHPSTAQKKRRSRGAFSFGLFVLHHALGCVVVMVLQSGLVFVDLSV